MRGNMTKKKKKNDEEFGAEEEGLGGATSAFDWDGVGAEEAAKILKGLESIIPQILKKTVVQGVGNILSGDEGIRSTFEENKKKPKEAMGFLLNQGDWMRKEILRIVSNEVRVFLENMDFGGEVAKILTTLSFEIKTEIRFAPNEDRVRPQVKNSVKVKRNGKNKTEDSKVFSEEEGRDEQTKKSFSRWKRKGRKGDSEE